MSEPSTGYATRTGRALTSALLALSIAPFLLGARGCVDEIAVGVEKPAIGPADAGSDAGGPGDAGSSKDAAMERDAGQCTDSPVLGCLNPEAGVEPGPCELIDCTGPLLLDPIATKKQAPALAPNCGDGIEPECVRDSSGLCNLQCPADTACGSGGTVTCKPGEFCAFALGKCGNTNEGGLCQAIPDVCTAEERLVCGCDGATYGNACTALAAGVSIWFEGSCGTEPEPCAGGCPGDAPTEPSTLCADKKHSSGPVCVMKPGGTCGWQWLECPNEGNCTALQPTPEVGTCWVDSDCELPAKCVGANICPCSSACFAADSPGTCQ